MKNTFIFCAALLLAACGKDSDDNPTISPDADKTVDTSEWTEGGSTGKTVYPKVTHFLNANDQKLSDTYYYVEGGKLRREVLVDYGTNVGSHTITYFYSGDKIVKEIKRNANGSSEVTDYEYKGVGGMLSLRTTTVAVASQEVRKVVTSYSYKDGKLDLIDSYDSQKEGKERMTFAYYPNNMVTVDYLTIASNGLPVANGRQQQHTFDDKGNLIKIEVMTDNESHQVGHTYDFTYEQAPFYLLNKAYFNTRPEALYLENATNDLPYSYSNIQEMLLEGASLFRYTWTYENDKTKQAVITMPMGQTTKMVMEY
jgi:lipoprotein